MLILFRERSRNPNETVEDFSRAIRLRPDIASSYICRGVKTGDVPHVYHISLSIKEPSMGSVPRSIIGGNRGRHRQIFSQSLVSRDDLRKIGDETGQGLSGSPCYAAVHLNRNGKPALGKIHHFGHITGKEAAVPIGNPEGGRPDDHTQSILMDLKRCLISIPGTPMNDHHRRGCRRQRGDYSRLCSPIRISSGWRSPAFLSHHWINDNCVDPWFCAMRR